MIRLDRVHATGAPQPGERAPALDAVSCAIMPGTTALLGARADGGPLLLEVCAGVARPRSGQATVLGQAVDAVRRRIAHVPLAPALPEPMTAREVLALAARVRGVAGVAEPDKRLERLGILALGPKRVSAMTPAEIRGLALCEALTSRADVVLIEEPYVGTSPEVAAALPKELAGCGRDGRTLVIATASTKVATEAGHTLLMSKGQLLPVAGVPPRPGDACVRITTADARELVTALLAIEDVHSVALEGRVVIARGSEAKTLLRAVQSVVARGGFAIDALETELASLDEARAAVIARMAS